MKRNRSKLALFFSSPPIIISLSISLLFLPLLPDSLPGILLQVGCALLGAAFEGLLVFLTRREYSPWQLLPLAVLLIPGAFSLQAAVLQTDYLWQLSVMLYFLLGLHYLLGFLGVWLLFRRDERS